MEQLITPETQEVFDKLGITTQQAADAMVGLSKTIGSLQIFVCPNGCLVEPSMEPISCPSCGDLMCATTIKEHYASSQVGS